jgi:diguanylate cyclase (GGDEF)-like protein
VSERSGERPLDLTTPPSSLDLPDASSCHVCGSSQPGLDALVTRVAVELMSVAATSLDASLEWTLQVMNEFFEVDTSFLRRNDFDRGLSVLVSEWPRRQDVPDPDPLGEVPFEADPVFAATRGLSQPFVIRPTQDTDAYQERVDKGAGVAEVSMAMVPLIHDQATIGVLGFVKFGDRSWEKAETNALQAVASLIVQLQSRIEAEERLRYQAFHDVLTSLPNRRALRDEIEKRLGRPEELTGLLLIGLDRFKALNDWLGHSAGDHFLIETARRLRAARGEDDFVARLAGDQFAVLLGAPISKTGHVALTDAVLEVIAAPCEMSGHHVSRSATLGLAFAGGSTTAEELLARADVALSAGKAQGGNQAVLFDTALRASAIERSETELQLRHAIDQGGLLLHYQPELDLRTGTLLAVEALVRWDHPHKGVLPAASFIKVAEDSGLIVDLDRWVLAEACRQMASWRMEYPELLFRMRVNMSPAQLASRTIVRLVEECLHENQLPGPLLCLEITEHAVMQDVEEAVQVLDDLKRLGVTLAIDDFGTGYSSMSKLKRLPVDALKIDQTFVAGLATDKGDRAIVDATVRLAQAFGLDAIAEGVETVDMVHELLGLGCHRAQGYLLCRPKAAADLTPILSQGGVDPSTFSRSLVAVTG